MQAASAKQAMLEVLMVIVSRDRGASARLAAHWESLMPALLVGYGATLSATDQATLRVLCILNAAKTEQHASAAADEDGHPSFLQAWTHEGIAGIGWVLAMCPVKARFPHSVPHITCSFEFFYLLASPGGTQHTIQRVCTHVAFSYMQVCVWRRGQNSA